MTKTTFDVNEKIALVNDWKSSGKTQADWCREHPSQIAPRTLRAYFKEVRTPADPTGQARQAIEEAMKRLSEILATLEAASDDAGAPEAAADPCRHQVEDIEQSEPVSEPPKVSAPLPQRLMWPHEHRWVG